MRKILKNFLLIIFIILLAFIITGCKKKDEKTDQKNEGLKIVESVTPAFYKITSDKNNSTIYLLSSINAAEDSIYPLNDKIMFAYNSSNYLAVEVDPEEISANSGIQAQLMREMLYEDGSKIKEQLGEDLYNKMVKLLNSKSSYISFYDVYKPTFFISLLEKIIYKDAGIDENSSVEMYFLDLAKKEAKEIFKLETTEVRYDILMNNPIELNKMMLEDYVVNYDKNISELKELYEAWKIGNIEKAEKLLFDTEGLSAGQVELVNSYRQKLYSNRNYGMVGKLEQYAYENKNVFCIVELGHIIGNDGIVKMMQQRGYNVEEIY